MFRLFENSLACPLTNERGFLPQENPLQTLPDVSELNKELNELARSLPELIQKKSLRLTIDKLNSVYANADILLEKGNQPQKQLAILILTLMAQAYVWEDFKAPRNSIPAVIAKNLYALCKRSQRFPTLTYADYILYNWRLKDVSKGLVLENIAPIFTFTGTKDEAWFIKIHVAIEAAASHALVYAFAASRVAAALLLNQSDVKLQAELMSLLENTAKSLLLAVNVLKRMTEECNPDYFWNTLRLYLNGWEKVKLPYSNETGVKFEGVATKDKLATHSYKGSSGAQSSIIPALDAAFGVKHDINGMFQTLLAFKSYMPVEHQIFISLLSRSPISKAVKRNGSPDLFAAWKSVIDNIKSFRMGHMGLVANYIHKPAEKTGIQRADIVGTGGTPIDEYLGDRHKATEATIHRLQSKL
jgi:indoleamine 2,3-dioxygenase